MRSTLAASVLTLLAFPVAAQEPTPIEVVVPERTEPVSYALEVSEILFDNCIGCHSSALAESSLNLEEFEGLIRGGKTGPGIVPGKPDESLVFLLAAHRRDPIMPPADEEGARPLTAEELGILQLWIEAGATDDTEAMVAELEAESKNAATIELGSLPENVQPIVAVDVTNDGRLVAAGRANIVHVYDTANGVELARLEGHKDIVQSLRFSPDGSRLAAGGYQVVLVWEVPESVRDAQEAGEEGASADQATEAPPAAPASWPLAAELGQHVFRVLALDFSPDGTLLATGGGEPSRSGEVKVWNLEQGTPVLELTELHSDTVFGVRFSPDGTKLATAGADKFARVVGLPDGQEQNSFEGHTHHVMAVDWNADGTQLVSGGADDVLKVWDVEKAEQLRTSQPAGKQVTALRWVPGKPIVAGASGDKSVRIWNPDDGKITQTLNGPNDFVFGVATSGDGTIIAAGGADGVLFLWDDQGNVLRQIAPPRPVGRRRAGRHRSGLSGGMNPVEPRPCRPGLAGNTARAALRHLRFVNGQEPS